MCTVMHMPKYTTCRHELTNAKHVCHQENPQPSQSSPDHSMAMMWCNSPLTKPNECHNRWYYTNTSYSRHHNSLIIPVQGTHGPHAASATPHTHREMWAASTAATEHQTPLRRTWPQARVWEREKGEREGKREGERGGRGYMPRHLVIHPFTHPSTFSLLPSHPYLLPCPAGELATAVSRVASSHSSSCRGRDCLNCVYMYMFIKQINQRASESIRWPSLCPPDPSGNSACTPLPSLIPSCSLMGITCMSGNISHKVWGGNTHTHVHVQCIAVGNLTGSDRILKYSQTLS